MRRGESENEGDDGELVNGVMREQLSTVLHHTGSQSEPHNGLLPIGRSCGGKSQGEPSG